MFISTTFNKDSRTKAQNSIPRSHSSLIYIQPSISCAGLYNIQEAVDINGLE